MPRPFERAACFEARYRAAAIWSASACCSMLPESPLARLGPARLGPEAFSRICTLARVKP